MTYTYRIVSEEHGNGERDLSGPLRPVVTRVRASSPTVALRSAVEGTGSLHAHAGRRIVSMEEEPWVKGAPGELLEAAARGRWTGIDPTLPDDHPQRLDALVRGLVATGVLPSSARLAHVVRIDRPEKSDLVLQVGHEGRRQLSIALKMPEDGFPVAFGSVGLPLSRPATIASWLVDQYRRLT